MDGFRVRGVGPVITERLQRIGITNRAGVQYFVTSHGACELLRVLGVGPKKGRRILRTIGVDAGCTKCNQPISLKVLERGYRTINEGKTCGNLALIRPIRPAPIIGRPAPIGQPYRSPLAPPIESPPPTQDYSPAGMRRSRMAANVAARAELDALQRAITRTQAEYEMTVTPELKEQKREELARLREREAALSPAPKSVQALSSSPIPSPVVTTSKGSDFLRAPDPALVAELSGPEEEKKEDEKSYYSSMHYQEASSGWSKTAIPGAIMDPSHVVAYVTDPKTIRDWPLFKSEEYTKKQTFNVNDVLGAASENVVIEGSTYGAGYIEDILKHGGKPETFETISSTNIQKPVIINTPKGTFLLAPKIADEEKGTPLVDKFKPVIAGENLREALAVPSWVKDDADIAFSNEYDGTVLVALSRDHKGAFVQTAGAVKGIPGSVYAVERYRTGNTPKKSNKPYYRVKDAGEVDIDFRGYNPASIVLTDLHNPANKDRVSEDTTKSIRKSVQNIKEYPSYAQIDMKKLGRLAVDVRKKEGRGVSLRLKSDKGTMSLYADRSEWKDSKRIEKLDKIATVGKTDSTVPIEVSVTEGYGRAKIDWVRAGDSFDTVELKSNSKGNDFIAYAEDKNRAMAYTIGKNEAGKAG